MKVNPDASQSHQNGISGMTAAQRGMEISTEAAAVGFDWQRPHDVLDKIDEELNEIRDALEHPDDKEHLEEEIGDLFFALVNFTRKTHINPDTAFMKGVIKFERRYRALEKLAQKNGSRLGDLDPKALDALWNRVKYEEAHGHELI